MKVLFVCTGNICRSPVAERMLEAVGKASGISLAVSSAGTRALSGKPIHPESVRALRERGIATSDFSSRLLTQRMIEDQDVILGMTQEHCSQARKLAPLRWRQIYSLGEFAALGLTIGSMLEADKPADGTELANYRHAPSFDIDDPIGGTPADFDRMANSVEGLVERVCR